jgi:exosortase E/protease (VPEID-CTERM system)
LSQSAHQAGNPPFARRALPVGRWCLLVGVLVVELMAITNRYDLQPLEADDLVWARWIGGSRHILGWAITTIAALILFRGQRLWTELERLPLLIRRYRRWPLCLAGHTFALAIFIAATALILKRDPVTLADAWGWAVAWVLAAAAALVLWAFTLLPPRVWMRLTRRHGASALFAGAAVGGAAWGAGLLARNLWLPMARSTLWLVALFLRLMRPDVVSRPSDFVVGTAKFRVVIAPECSGYEGIGLIWIFLGVSLWLCRHELRFPRAFLLLPAGTVVIWLANVARIAALVLLGAAGFTGVAQGGFHSQAGWIAFNAVGLGLVAVSRRLPFFAAAGAIAPRAVASARSGLNPTAAYVAPLLALVGVMMMTAALSEGSGFDRFYAVRVLVAGGVLWHYRREYPDLRWSVSWVAVAIGLAVFVLWMALETAWSPGDSREIAEGLSRLGRGWGVAWLAFRVAGSVVVVPLAEELAFRGFLLRRLIAPEFIDVAPGRFTWPSFLISSILFGALHGRWLAGTVAGVFYALALYHRRELADSVIAHATTNALIAAYVLATGAWSLWS